MSNVDGKRIHRVNLENALQLLIDSEWVPVHPGSMQVRRGTLRDTENQGEIQEMTVLTFLSRADQPGPAIWWQYTVPLNHVLASRMNVPDPTA